jgi:hypothetical protein
VDKTILIIIGLAILVVFSTYISTRTILDGRRKWYRSLTGWGWSLVITNAGIIVLTICQYNVNTNKEKKKDESFKKEQQYRDSIITAKYEASTRKTTIEIAKTLGEYGFRYDSSQHALAKFIQDSVKRTVVIDETNPVLKCTKIEYIRTVWDAILYGLLMKSTDASSCNFKINHYTGCVDSIGNYKYVGCGPLINNTTSISKDSYFEPFIAIPLTFYPISFIYIYINGTYSNLEKTKSFSIDELYFYNVKGKTFGCVSGSTRLLTLNQIKLLSDCK